MWPRVDGMRAFGLATPGSAASKLAPGQPTVAFWAPPRAHAGDVLMPDVSGRGRGNLMVTVKVVTPKKLTREQRTLLEQLASSLPAETFKPIPVSQEDDKGLFDRVRDIFG